jgi:pimeloyl-ACP methyl ester carboxylesterase
VDGGRVRGAMERLLAEAPVVWRSGLTRMESGLVHHLEAGQGDPLVLLHGAGGGCANWFRLLPLLSSRFHIYAPDLPGYGLSPAVRLSPPLGVQGSRWLSKWLELQGLRSCHLVGTSLGGLIALRLAAAAPQRVRRLCVIDAVGLGSRISWLIRLGGVPLAAPLLRRSSRRAVEQVFKRLLTGDAARIPAGARDALLDYLWACDAAVPPGTLHRALRHFGTLRGQREVLDAATLARIAAPTLVLWGARDALIPVAHGVRAVSHLPNARLHVVEGVGHSPNWEAPEIVGPQLMRHFTGAHA